MTTTQENPIARRRRAKGWTQLELANRIGCHPRLVCRWETGEGKPSTSNAVSLAKIFGLRLEPFLRELGI